MRPLAAATVLMSLCSFAVPCAHAGSVPPETGRIEALAASPEPGVSSLAERLLAGLDSYERLRDYRAIFLKTEKDKTGAMGQEERIFLKFEKPFKIFMGWTNTHKKGLQVHYERGKHDNKLVIHKPGLAFGLAQVIFLPQDSPWVREGSAAYNIEDAGIGTFLYDFATAVVTAAERGQLSVAPAGATDGPVEVSFPGTQKDKIFFAHRIRVSFDPETSLPVRMELYDWQDRPAGTYVYDDLRVDVGPDDPELKKHANRRLYRVYTGDRG
ncbi:MAG: hypothetical protein MOGMAGMI_02189 [Candidatus Omnitrophica bacterium]|nr:hypothetical protein [Candidatus Omnitrophota bacterium]